VVEGRIQPGGCVVARVAGLREVRSHVTWIRCSLIVLQVTRGTGRAGQVVVVVDVAIGALTRRHGVHAGQRESCQRMINEPFDHEAVLWQRLQVWENAALT